MTNNVTDLAVRPALDNSAISIVDPSLHWQSIKKFTGITTLSEKIWRIVNNMIFTVAGLCLYIIGRRKPSHKVTYLCYTVFVLAIQRISSSLPGYMAYKAASVPQGILTDEEGHAQRHLQANGFTTQKIALHKSGVVYDARLITYPETVNNGKWSIHAFGVFKTMEMMMEKVAIANHAIGVNTLLINGPSVGRSSGFPTRYQLGAGYETGLQLLEQEIKATHIILKGYCFGEEMIAEAILTHQFTQKVKYLVISDRASCRFSDIASIFWGNVVYPILRITGTELDSVAAAEKLKTLSIQHLIIQHASSDDKGTDNFIPDRVGLAAALAPSDNRVFFCSEQIDHSATLPEPIRTGLKTHVQQFLKS
jgi:CHLPS protein DUF818